MWFLWVFQGKFMSEYNLIPYRELKIIPVIAGVTHEKSLLQ